MNDFIITDEDDGFQRMMKLGEGEFIYKCEKGTKTIEDIIIYDDLDIHDAIEGYYCSVAEVVSIYEKEYKQIIAECAFEKMVREVH